MQVEISPKTYQPAELTASPEKELPVRLYRSLQSIVEKEGYVKHKIYNRCVSTNGGNYLGVLYEIDVKGNTKDGEKELHIFVKNIIEEGAMKIFSISDVYVTEMFAYKELSKVFAELQANADIPLPERYIMIKTYDESDTEAIIMENVAKKGFSTYHRMDTVSLSFVEEAVKQLAKFHALSFVLKDKRPDYFAKKIMPLKHPFIFKEEWLELVKSMWGISIHHVDAEYKDRLAKMNEVLAEKYAEYFNDDSIKACLCHGDYRPNNIMTKIHDGETPELIPVDYQLIHYGCPIFDFLYLINTCTDRQFRKAHMTDLKNLYYETLSKFLSYFDIKVGVIYPREEFEKVYKEKLDYGLMTAMLFLPFILVSEEEVPDISQGFSDISFPVDEKFADRLRGIIEDYIEWGYI